MGRMVIQSIDDLALGADATQDIWSVIASATSRIKLHGFELTSADLVAELISLTLKRITAAGTGGSAPGTEELLDEEFSAVTATFRQGDTTPGTPGGNLKGFQWEQLGPVGHLYTPEMRPKAKVSDGFALVCNTALTATVSGWVCWEEL